NGFSDPFCDLLVLDASGKQIGKLETQKIMKTLDPVWDHVFYVSDEIAVGPSDWPSLTLHFEVYDWDAVGSNDFLGQVHRRDVCLGCVCIGYYSSSHKATIYLHERVDRSNGTFQPAAKYSRVGGT